MKAFISTIPFGETSPLPCTLLSDAGISFTINPLGRKMKTEELPEYIADCDILIAGTEKITSEVLDTAPNLKLIARVGVGLDNIPFEEVRKRGISVSYTPDAPKDAVAELVIGLLINGARNFTGVSDDLRRGVWNKHMGHLLSTQTVGIAGTGRIGKKIIQLLQPFQPRIIAHDIKEDTELASVYGVEYVSKDTLFRESDLLSINMSASFDNRHFVDQEALAWMRPSAYLINVARGELVDEGALFTALSEGKLRGAALDVFSEEPYRGPLVTLPSVTLTAHIGAATVESRLAMEIGAVEEVIRFARGAPLQNPAVEE